MQVTLLFFFFYFCFCIQRTASVEIEITTFVPLKLCSTGEGLELDKTMKEWCCVVLHAKKHYGQCIGFAVLSLTWSLKTAGHIVFLRVGFLGP